MTKNERLARVCRLLFQLNREEILWDGDWWYGTDTYDFNFFDRGGMPSIVHVVVYDMTKGEAFNYSPISTVYRAEISTGVTA